MNWFAIYSVTSTLRFVHLKETNCCFGVAYTMKTLSVLNYKIQYKIKCTDRKGHSNQAALAKCVCLFWNHIVSYFLHH